MRACVTLLLAMCFLLGACATGPSAVVDTGERFSDQKSGIEDYRLGVGDKVRITVFNEPTLSGEFSVNADGALSLPLIGDIHVIGKQASEVTAQMQTMLAAGYLRDPKVNTEVITYRPFFILGEVKMPGQYPYASGMTALNSIALAQGFTPRAQRSVVYIRRAGSSDEQAFKIAPDLRVWPGDTIRVGERYF